MPEVREGRIGRFEILGELGRGAMGIVYQAHDPQLDRIVAIKSFRADVGLPSELRADFRSRFYQEARAAGRLNHPNIVGVYDVVEIDETPYIVMEYVEGQTLAHRIAAGGPLPPPQAVPVVLQVCRALEYAHARGVVHRDIKPANILIAGGWQVKVSDFGIARIAGNKFTHTGVTLGSPSYMSPEQVRGAGVDGRSDLFSLGVVLYEALTGAEAFPGDNPSTVLYRIVHEDPAPLRERNASVSPALDAVISRALAKEADQRYPTARAFSDALSLALDPAEGATRATEKRTAIVERLPRRGRRWLAAIVTGCLVVAVAAGAALWSRRSAKESSAPSATSSGNAADDKPSGPQSVSSGPSAGHAASRRAAGMGAIRVVTNPSVEVYVDGAFKGRVSKGPFLISRVPVGERVVSLRLGPMEQRFLQTVGEGETLRLTYRFPE